MYEPYQRPLSAQCSAKATRAQQGCIGFDPLLVLAVADERKKTEKPLPWARPVFLHSGTTSAACSTTAAAVQAEALHAVAGSSLLSAFVKEPVASFVIVLTVPNRPQ